MKSDTAHRREFCRPLTIRAAESRGTGSPEFMEHRWGQRRSCVARVCITAAAGLAGYGRLRNVSMSGAFLETALPLPLFAQIAIAVLHDDGARHRVEFTATVVRSDPGGFGIEWNETTDGPICRLLGCAAECGRKAS
jgi:hypothetical protein